MRRAVERSLALAIVAMLASTIAVAQDDDVPLPPRIDAPAPAAAAASTTRALKPAESARLAPLPEERPQVDDEILVIGETGWRLPDLGSDWRAERDAEEREQRFRRTFLPLYDPENPPMRADSLMLNREAQRVGFIQIFRLRFGRRSND
jgi:hypothetical protein